jgi:hypothetical protein
VRGKNDVKVYGTSPDGVMGACWGRGHIEVV